VVRAAIYTRVSTEEQADHGYSIDEQERRCRQFIEQQEDDGWTYVDTFAERGVSGTLRNREALDRLLERTDEFDVVVINSLDRLGRSTKNLLELYDRFERDKVALVFLRERLDTTTPVGRLLRTVLSAIAEFERDLIAERTSSSLAARARKGSHTGGPRPYGYAWINQELVVEPAEAEIVKRIFADYATRGMSQRSIVRSLNDDGVRAQTGGEWRQSAIARMLANRIYAGQIEFKGDVIDGRHDEIVSLDLWNRAQEVRAGALKRGGGRNPDGAHLLVRGVLRCPLCRSAMLPRKARPGVERERYVCSGRIEHGSGFCAQPSIRRELIDEPFLAHLLDGYIDLEATRKRIEERLQEASGLAREAVAHAEGEVARIERAVATTERDYDAGDITGKQYAAREARLTEELDGAGAALGQARDRVAAIESAGPVGDAEQALLDYLADLKRATAAGAGAAPDLNALRNVIHRMFESIKLEPWDEGIALAYGDASGPPLMVSRVPVGEGRRYWLIPTLRSSAVEAGTLRPIGQEMPVPPSPQYPTIPSDNFLCRYCWW
jgi:site-specific DNA recombinase